MPYRLIMDTDEVRWVVRLAETGHMTQTATSLHITQPTLSRALARVEREIGAPLFDRVSRRLRLNAYGEIFCEHARRALADLDAASDRIAARRDPDRGTVRLGYLHSMATWYVPEMISRFRDHAPGVRFDLTQAPGHEIAERLREGTVDLVITAPRIAGDDVGWRVLHTERLCAALPVGHRLAGRRRLRLAALAGERFVALRPEFGMRQLTDELCRAAGFVADIAFEVTEIASMEALVAAGLGVAIVPAPRPGHGEPRAIYPRLTDSGAQRSIGLAWMRHRPRPPVVARFADFLITADRVER